MERTAPAKPDLSEKGGVKDGTQQASDRRLFMLLLAFGDAHKPAALVDPIRAVTERHDNSPAVKTTLATRFVLYEDLRDPRGVGLLTLSEDPGQIMNNTRQILADPAFAGLTPKHEFTMLGRTYSLGYEPDLDETLLHRPTRTALNPDWPWAIWYPLRRSGLFTQLLPHEQKAILQEHGQIGMSFGYHDLAHDIRLMSYGLDASDNDFVIGLTGKELFPLSAIVQAMRKTQQTSLYLTSLGPFFVGRALWRSR